MKNYKHYLIICGLFAIIIIICIIYCGYKLIVNKNIEESFSISIENITEENINNVEDNTNNNYEKRIIVHITGEIVNKGIVELNEGDRIINAIEKSGGVTELADLSKINLAYIVEDGMKIYVPSINDLDEIETISLEAGDNIIEDKNKDKSNTGKKISVNINTADKEELTKVPGIGESTADKIINYRNENNGFKTIDDIKNVSGIGESKFKSIKEYIFVK